jgi:exodeoxyribonuclease VII large subunit
MGRRTGEEQLVTDGPRALTVSEAMGMAKRALESLPLRVVGEISEFTDRPGYKAVYFTLADGSAVMPCLIWRDVYEASGVQMRSGMLVEVTGGMTVYAPKGRMQFQARTLAAAGEGVLRLQVAALARKLEAEGLFHADRKRELPEYPTRIGLVTSPRGKAVHDVILTLRRRYPTAELVIAGVAVEGAGAAGHIVEGLLAIGEAGVDVVILARGGGSYEDLMPFNEESVARAVAACPVPVVTGIGHEPDTSIADMVADLRASTPTAAAEAVAPSSDEVVARFRSAGDLLARGLRHAAQRASRRLAALETRPVLADPRTLLLAPAQRIDLAASGLTRALPLRVARERERLTLARRDLPRAVESATTRQRERAKLLAARLEDLSPLGILARGYAVCYDESGRRVLRSASDMAAGDRVRVRLHQGVAGCLVESVDPEGER